MKITIPVSQEEVELLRLAFSIVEMAAEIRMHDKLPFLERQRNTLA